MHRAARPGLLAVRQIAAAVAAIGLLFTLSPRAYAVSAIPDPLVYWDSNNDAVADDTGVKGYKAGASGYWSSGPIARYTDAFNEWKNNTDFDPATGTSGQPVYLDRVPPCTGTFYPGGGLVYLGVVCPTMSWKGAFEYYKLSATPTYMNNNMSFGGLSWWYGVGAPPADQPYSIHFGGTLVHELGHWILLDDLHCAAGQTMCHDSVTNQDTVDQFTLEAQDISDANNIY